LALSFSGCELGLPGLGPGLCGGSLFGLRQSPPARAGSQ